MPSVPESFINRPLAIAALTLLGSVGAAAIKDRLQSESADGANSVRIANLEQRQADTVREREFQQFMAEVLRRLDSIEKRVGDYSELRGQRSGAK